MFTLNGKVNRQNCRWIDNNPHWTREDHIQHPEKVNVWVGIFFQGNLNGTGHLEFLQELNLANLFTDPDEADVPNRNMWFQQDSPFCKTCPEYLDDVFPLWNSKIKI